MPRTPRLKHGQGHSVLLWLLSATLVGCALAGCSGAKWIAVEPGVYNVISCRDEAGDVALQTVRKLDIDRGERLIVITIADGPAIRASFVPRARAEWASGCPTNLYTHRMEVLGIERDELDVGPITLTNPVLVRDCPPDPARVVLREDGDIGNAGGSAGSACSGTRSCVCFEPE